ncbi:butyrophilin-like protein 8 [Lates japonicus]
MSHCERGTPMRALLVSVLISLSDGAADQWSITARPKQNTTLPCEAPSKTPIIAAEWSRPEMVSKYVFFYRDEQADKTNQDPAFEGRVELADHQLKNGNLSVILRRVTVNDTGTYECRVKQEAAVRRKRAFISSDPVSIVKLTVIESRNAGTGQHTAGLLVSVLPVMFVSLLLLPF